MTAVEALERPEVVDHAEGPALLWRFEEHVRSASSAVLGGGIGARSWIINAQVPIDYHHDDPGAHVASIGVQLGLAAHDGVGLLTAASVRGVLWAEDDGACCAATVGVSTPTWAAAADGAWSRWTPGTVNLVCWLPAALSDAALVNAVVTATEAKTQALLEREVPGTGTASDAIVVCCPAGGSEPYGGPRSMWGARLARAVHRAVLAGVA